MAHRNGFHIKCTVCAADARLTTHPVGSDVKAGSCAWEAGECLYCTLDDYNNGYLCAPPRD
jgi:hypothetical protein